MSGEPEAPPGTRLAPYLMLALATLFWSGNWVVGRAVHEVAPPIGLNFWRWTVAVLILAPLTAREIRRNWPVIVREWKVLLILGASGVALFQCMLYTGLRSTTAINALLLNSVFPVIMVAMSWAVRRETITRRQALGIFVSFAGVLAIITRGEPEMLARLSFNRGDLWILAALPVWGAYSLLLDRRPQELSGLGLVFVIGVVGLVLMAPFYAIEMRIMGRMPFDGPTVASVLYIGAFASVAAYFLWNRAVPRVGANKAAFSLHLMPAFGTAMAVSFLGESVHWYQLGGISLILLGVYLSTIAAARA